MRSTKPNSETASYVAGIGVHSYQDDQSDTHLQQTNDNHPNVFIFGIEARETSVDYGSWDRAEDYVLDILDPFPEAQRCSNLPLHERPQL
ncbi:hypothetical protein CAEBREN_20616 [Caenorhabditis brenneri]|uniref:Glycosyl hydrolase family 30 TIM-barrel domain-containing protein n=1 Tax=Caenorhabditis brenneri TaxID=135651 RepID=G0NJX0_CAEBE|nr:hypothetical protein CAEBREN_20616 [Caenorhabditis brenneri]